MDKFNFKQYLREGKLLKEEMSIEMGDCSKYNHLKLSTNSGYYGGDINDDGTVDFSVVYYGEDDRDGRKFDVSNWKEMLGPDHAFVKISNQIPTEVESVDDYIMVKVDLEDLKGISDLAEGRMEEPNINEMDYATGMSNRYILYKLRENREKLIRLYAQLVNNNKASWKVYDSMIFEIEDARDNIYPNWKENLIKADEEHLDLMNQINSALKKDKLLRLKIK